MWSNGSRTWARIMPRCGSPGRILPRVETTKHRHSDGRRNDLLTFEAYESGRQRTPKIKKPRLPRMRPSPHRKAIGVSAVPAVSPPNTTAAVRLYWNTMTGGRPMQL